jgi:DNA-directed RNA polymerase specialized sigma24 family protein
LNPADCQPAHSGAREWALDLRDDGLRDRLSVGCDAVLLEDLYDAYGPSCYQLAHRMVTEPELASAIVRDVFLDVWTRTAVFELTRGSVHVWLLGATHRMSAAALRRQPQLRGGAGTKVFVALPGLEAMQRDVLELAYFGGHTQLEIATLTGCAVGTVKTLTLQAMRQFAIEPRRPAS